MTRRVAPKSHVRSRFLNYSLAVILLGRYVGAGRALRRGVEYMGPPQLARPREPPSLRMLVCLLRIKRVEFRRAYLCDGPCCGIGCTPANTQLRAN